MKKPMLNSHILKPLQLCSKLWGRLIWPHKFMDQVLTNAVNDAVKDKPSITGNIDSLIAETYKRFVDYKLDDFPRMCQVAMMQNKIKMEEMRQYGNKGRFTDSYGWSNDGDFKFEFDIPQDLYLFMVNLVYKNFWSNTNKKIHKAFMNAICRGDDPMTTLMKVKTYYGSNKDAGLTV